MAASLSEYAVDLENNVYRAASILVRKSNTAGESSPDSDFVHLGQVKSVMTDISPVTTEADTAGRETEISIDFEAQFTLQQTSNTEISNLRALTENLMDIIITTRPVSGNVQEADVSDYSESDDSASYPQTIADTATFTTDDFNAPFFEYEVDVVLSEPTGTAGDQTADVEILDEDDNVLASETGVTVPEGSNVTVTLEAETNRSDDDSLAIKVTNTGGGGDIELDSFTITSVNLIRFDSILLNLNGTINFSADESEISVTVPYRISSSDIPSKALTN